MARLEHRRSATGRRGRLSGPAALVACLMLAATLAGGCAARFQPMGEPVQTPVLGPDHVTMADGYRLPVRQWRPNPRPEPKAVLVALHGFNDYSNSFATVGPYFAHRGYAFYAYDQRGFGATRDPGIWPGTETLVADLEAVARAARARHPQAPLVLLGESMGGAVVLNGLAGPHASPWLQAETDRVVLVAPAVWGWSSMDPLPRLALAVAYAMVPGISLEAPKGILRIQASDNIEMMRAMGRDPLVIKGARVDAMHGLVNLMEGAMDVAAQFDKPALVVYGGKEQIIPPKPVARFKTRLPPERTVVATYPEGYHMLLRDLKAEVVLADIAAWLDDPEAPLPSGLGHPPAPLPAAALGRAVRPTAGRASAFPGRRGPG